MPPPSILTVARHVLSRALRETGQALDRVGVMGAQHAVTTRQVGDDPYIFDDHLSRHRQRVPLVRHGAPDVSDDVAFLAPCATLVGRVRLSPGCSVWYGAVLRADEGHCGIDARPDVEERWRGQSPDERQAVDPDPWGTGGGGEISIGPNSNVQDGCVVTAREDHATVGEGVTIGHLAQIHSAKVGDYALIGMGSIISPLATVEAESFVAAGSVVGRGETVKSGELWGGNPARKLRDLTPEERGKLKYQSDEYVRTAAGQSGVMELGGNVAEDMIDPQFTLGAGDAEGGETARTGEEVVEREETIAPEPLRVKK